MGTQSSTRYVPPDPVQHTNRKWPDRMESKVFRRVVFASVDLRDGNQALERPMNPQQKLEFFLMLIKMGFREIEVGFPSASQDDFDFVRMLIEGNHIPDNVTIAVLTQCREDLIRRTFKSLAGVKRAIVHAYIATSKLHMQKVFGLTEDQTVKRAVQAVELISKLAEHMPESNINLQFSPEEFTDTNAAFALRICEEVFSTWGKASSEKPMILNLPATVERMWPHRVADRFEHFCENFPFRDSVTISAHPHNDQGMAVASASLAVLAGADRVEGTLLGHGERTGNVDLITMILNSRVMGIETEFDVTNLPEITETVVRLTGMPVDARHPYAGELAFTAFSGSHQDAIAKGLEDPMESDGSWKVPYLIVNPSDVGRRYEKLVRINSQSGKGGIAYVLRNEYGIDLPKAIQPFVRLVLQGYLDRHQGEATAELIYSWLKEEFMQPNGQYQLVRYRTSDDAQVTGIGEVSDEGKALQILGQGNGPIDAFVKGLQAHGVNGFTIVNYIETTTGFGSDAPAVSFMELEFNGIRVWGIALDTNTTIANVKAILAAINRSKKVLATQG